MDHPETNLTPEDAWRSLADSPAGRLLKQLYSKSRPPSIQYPAVMKSSRRHDPPPTFIPGGGKLGVDPRVARSQRRPYTKVPHFNKPIVDTESNSAVALIPRRRQAEQSASEIREIDWQRTYYRPPCSRPVATESEKRRLNELFTHKGGKALPEELLHPIGLTPTELAQERKRKADLLRKRIEAGFDVPKEREETPKEMLFKQIVEEIDERSTHIAQMDRLGGQEPHDVVRMRGEIAQRFRELERIDPEKTRQLMEGR